MAGIKWPGTPIGDVRLSRHGARGTHRDVPVPTSGMSTRRTRRRCVPVPAPGMAGGTPAGDACPSRHPAWAGGTPAGDVRLSRYPAWASGTSKGICARPDIWYEHAAHPPVMYTRPGIRHGRRHTRRTRPSLCKSPSWPDGSHPARHGDRPALPAAFSPNKSSL